MASPDVREYVDLSLLDKDAQDLVDAALDDAEVKLPDWTPREGNTEVVLIEALSLTVQELIFAVNRLPGAVTEVLLRLFDVDRSEGAPPTATVTFTLSDTLGHTIPEGTVVRLDLGPDVDPVDFTTDVGLIIGAGSAAGNVAVTATENTIRANDTAAGTDLELIDAHSYVELVELQSAVAGGLEAEDDAAFLTRGAQTLTRLVSTLVLPDHFTAAALDNVNVERATTVDNYDPAVGPNPGDNPGHATVAVAGPAGAALSAGIKTTIETDLEAKALANLDVHVADPTLNSVAVTASVRRLAGFTSTDVEDDVEAALTAYLSPDNWPWDTVVRRNELIALISGVEGVAYVETLTVPAADVNLNGVAPLTQPGALAITVTEPP